MVGSDGGRSPVPRGIVCVNAVGWLVPGYDLEPHRGGVVGRREVAGLPVAGGRAVGEAVDAEGGVWWPIWDGWCVRRYLPDGNLDQIIELPVPRPTSISFGGDDLGTMFITSARTRLPASTLADAPLSGGLFACRPGVVGAAVGLFQG